MDTEERTITFPNLTPFAPDSSIYNGTAINVDRGSERWCRRAVARISAAAGRHNDGLYRLEPDDMINREKYLIEVRFTTPTPSYQPEPLQRSGGVGDRSPERANASRAASTTTSTTSSAPSRSSTDEANRADAQIEVDFEYVPLFRAGEESLAGVAGDLQLQ